MPYTPLDWVAHHARTRPEMIALHGCDDGEIRSWRDLDGRVGRLAHALLTECGLQPGDRIAQLTDGNIRFIELQFACIRAGLTLVPLNFRLTAKELAAMCRELAPKVMVTDATWRSVATEVAERAGIALTIDWTGPCSLFERLASGGRYMRERMDMRPDEIPLILFTSGSTGRPKAAQCSLEALICNALNQAEAARVAEVASHVFTPLPLFHSGGINAMTNPVLFFGGKATISARFDPSAAARFVGDPTNGVTHLALVPLMYQLMSDTPEFAKADYSRLRAALIAGGRMRPALQDKWAAKGVAFIPQYGGTETGPAVTSLPPARADKAREGSVGTKVMHVQIRLVDADQQDVATGEPGEIWLKGPAITPGYIGRAPELDFTDGWFRTGDVARVDADGYYYVVDRIKDMYKSGGENVSSLEVELVLAEHPDILEVAVIGVAHPKWGEVGLAVIVPRGDARPDTDSIRSFCLNRLAKFKHPHHCAWVDALPRNTTGKVSKDLLRQQYNGTVTA